MKMICLFPISEDANPICKHVSKGVYILSLIPPEVFAACRVKEDQEIGRDIKSSASSLSAVKESLALGKPPLPPARAER